MKSLKAADAPRYLITDSKLYDLETIESYLKEVPLITLIPGTIKMEQEMIHRALQAPDHEWTKIDEKNRSVSFALTHYGVLQRWIVVWSQEAQERAVKGIEKRCRREREKLEKWLKKLEKQEYACEADGKRALKESMKTARFYHLVQGEVEENKKYSGKGLPCVSTPCHKAYQIRGKIAIDEDKKNQEIQESSCFIIGPTIAKQELSDIEVLQAYKNQNASVEKCFRFLKDPLIFTSSLFVKKSLRIMGLLMIMTLALLVYAIAQRRLRRALRKMGETLPNQIHQETQKPTLRWIFQLLGGIAIIQFNIGEMKRAMIKGMTELKKRILGYFGETVQKIYEIKNVPAPQIG